MKIKSILFGIITITLAACRSQDIPTKTVETFPTITQTQPPTQPPPSQTPKPVVPTIEVLDEPEVVFTWDIDRCADNQLVDLPARAIRNADGQVQIYTSSTTSYRLVGSDFNSLTTDCNPVFQSSFDRNPANYNHSEWIGAPYTIDGQTVYAIIHQEYHGDQVGSTWQADGDFSDQQGYQGWSYQSWDGNSYIEMTYNPEKNEWMGYQPLCLISPNGMHPGVSCQPSRTWTSPISGKVTVSGSVYDLGFGGGNGVSAKILQGEEEIWSTMIEEGDGTGQMFDLAIDVEVGDELHFQIDSLGDTGWDATFFNPGINLGPEPCPSGRHDMCTLISLTHAVSTDGGASFSQTLPPSHLIAAFPYQYDPDWMRAIWQPSNIIQNPNDGAFYALIQLDEHPSDYATNQQYMCLIRTDTLDDPASWRAWDGNGFNMRFINPYQETLDNPEDYICPPVTPDIGALTYGLSYNSYLEQFVAVGVGFDGFYFSVSDDLIHWSPRQFIMEAAQVFASGAEPPYYPYPTLIDHNSPSLSFDVTGQMPYLYFTRMNGSQAAINTDLLRVQVKFSK